MKKPSGGYLYKRWRERHINADSATPGTFYMSWRVNGKTYYRCLHTKDRDEAERRRHEELSRLDLSDHEKYLRALIEAGERARAELNQHIHGPGAVTIENAWQSFVDSRRRPSSGDRTMSGYKSAWDQFMSWVPKNVKRLRDITPGMAEEYVRELEKVKGKARTVRSHLQSLRLIWKSVEPHHPSPWTALRTTKKTDITSYRPLATEEIKRLLKQAKGEYYGLILLGYTTGLRRKDSCLLTWDQVDIPGKVINLTPAKTSRNKKHVHIPILPDLMQYLISRKGNRTGYVFPKIVKDYKLDGAKQVALTLRKLFNDADVWDNQYGKASFHSLRSTWQTLNDEAGTSRVITRAVLGHSGQAMSDTYSKVDVLKSRRQIEKAIPRVV